MSRRPWTAESDPAAIGARCPSHNVERADSAKRHLQIHRVQRTYLGFGVVEVRVVADDVVGYRQAGFAAGLSREDAAGLFLGLGVARQQAFDLGVLAAVNDEYAIHLVAQWRFDQQRYDEQLVSAGGCVGLPHRLLADPGVQNAFEALAGAGIGKYDVAHGQPVEAPIAVNDGIAERVADFIERRLTGLDDFACDHIGIDDHGTKFGEPVCNGRLAAGDTASQADSQWRVAVVHSGEDGEHPVHDRVAPQHRQPAGPREIRAERNRLAAVAILEQDQ